MSDPQTSQRRAERFNLGSVAIEVANMCGVGRIRNISSRGMRIEDSGLHPSEGDAVRVVFVISGEEPAFELDGVVTRHTETGGFAIDLGKHDERLERVIASLRERARETGLE